MEAVITASGDFPIERFARDHGIVIPAVLTIGDARESFLYYFEENEDQNRDFFVFLKTNKARKTGNVYTIYSNSTHYTEYNFFRKLMEIPSLVIDFQYVRGGKHYFHLRFIDKYLDAFSSLVASESFPAINSVQYVGPVRRSMDNAKLFSEFFRTMRISFRFTPPEGQENLSVLPGINGDFAGELRYIDENGKIKFNLYLKDCDTLSPGQYNIKPLENGIVEITYQNEMLNELIFLSKHVAFPNFGIYFKRTDGILIFEALIPGIYSKEYIKKIFNVRKNLPQLNIVLDSINETF